MQKRRKNTYGMTLAEKLAFYSAPPDANGCRLWTGSKRDGGYGQMHYKGRVRKVCQLVLEAKLGRPIKPGHGALHTCDNPPCITPEHLWEGTQLRNIRDMQKKGRQSPPPRHIGEDHPKAVLNDDQVYEIRAERRLSGRQMSAKYDVPESTISLILHRKTWAHLPMRADDAQTIQVQHTQGELRIIGKAKGTHKEIMKQFEVSRATVARARRKYGKLRKYERKA